MTKEEKARAYDEQKPTNSEKPKEWSEEDEERIQSILFSIGYCKDEYPNKKDYSKDIDWLKSLRPSWKPSEEQMLKDAIEGEIISTGLHTGIAIYDEKYTKRLDKFKRGDKVLVIVLPKEEPTNG